MVHLLQPEQESQELGKGCEREGQGGRGAGRERRPRTGRGQWGIPGTDRQDITELSFVQLAILRFVKVLHQLHLERRGGLVTRAGLALQRWEAQIQGAQIPRENKRVFEDASDKPSDRTVSAVPDSEAMRAHVDAGGAHDKSWDGRHLHTFCYNLAQNCRLKLLLGIAIAFQKGSQKRPGGARLLGVESARTVLRYLSSSAHLAAASCRFLCCLPAIAAAAMMVVAPPSAVIRSARSTRCRPPARPLHSLHFPRLLCLSFTRPLSRIDGKPVDYSYFLESYGNRHLDQQRTNRQ